jgi:hypothetical protein
MAGVLAVCPCFEALLRKAPHHEVKTNALTLRCSAQRSLEGCATSEVITC